MPTKWAQVVAAVGDRLRTIAPPDYETNFDGGVYCWQSLPTEYDKNTLVYRDISAVFLEKNRQHHITIKFEIEAIVSGENPSFAGSEAEGDIIVALGQDTNFGTLALDTQLKRSRKSVQTAGKTHCAIVLEVEITIAVPRFERG